MNSSFTQIFLVTPVRQGVGLTSAALGIVRALQRLGVEVGFAKPIAQEEDDNSDHFARAIRPGVRPAPVGPPAHLGRRSGTPFYQTYKFMRKHE